MENLRFLAASSLVMTWIAPVAIIAVATFAGWIVEQIVIRWVRSAAHHVNHRRESMVGRAIRGHITFWGFLLGVGIAANALAITRTTQFAGFALGLWIHNGLLALFIISLSIMLSGIATALIVASSAATARPVVSLVTNLARFIVLAIGFLLVLPLVGVNIAPWLATLGIAGLAVSLALQATLTDLVSGMLLLVSRQLAIGEYVKLSTGEEGYISDITWRTTTIRQLSNNVVIVPNSKMTSLPVTNFHTNTQNSGVSVEFGVSYASDLDQVERVTLEVAQDVMRTVQGGMPDFTPTLRYNTLGDYSIRLTVKMQAQEISDQYLIQHEFIKRLRSRYREEGIIIPYPIQTVQLRESHDPAATAPERDGVAEAVADPHGSQASANSNDASSR